MKDSVFTLFLLVALVLGISFAIPAEDGPDTPYDESEQLPCESTVGALIKPLEEPAEVPRAVLKRGGLLQSDSTTGFELIRTDQQTVSPRLVPGSLPILGHSLRC